MSEIPHEYTVREWNPDKEEMFKSFVSFIREYGYKKRVFFNKEYIYFDIDGYSYWTMGKAIDKTTIINRAKI